jgi:hypothetical protein
MTLYGVDTAREEEKKNKSEYAPTNPSAVPWLRRGPLLLSVSLDEVDRPVHFISGDWGSASSQLRPSGKPCFWQFYWFGWNSLQFVLEFTTWGLVSVLSSSLYALRFCMDVSDEYKYRQSRSRASAVEQRL